MKKRHYCLIIIMLVGITGFSQISDQILTIEFVEIVNGNRDEAVYYYKNNWLTLREMAVERDYIHSFRLLECPRTEESSHQLILETVYLNSDQYEKREEHFEELIEEKGVLELLNDKKPSEFRRSLFSRGGVRPLSRIP